jgi:predicted small lipoprotein YifL
MTPRQLVLSAIAAALLSVAGCGSLYLGDNPGPDTRKETGPLTVPPRAVRDGTAR